MAANVDELKAFVAVASSLSFAAAAAQMNVTRPALSHALRRLEDRVGTRLLNRTTRSVALSDAGARLLEKLAPALRLIDDAFVELAEEKGPSGPLRITVPQIASRMVIEPKFGSFVRTYPDIELEITVSDSIVDIVADGFDAGIRHDEAIARDMIGVRLTSPFSFVAVASPAYLQSHGAPTHPQELLQHATIGYRFPTSGAIYSWEFEKGSQHHSHRPSGAPILNDIDLTIRAAVERIGIGYLARPLVLGELETGKLNEVLPDWSVSTPGLFLYYPSRRHNRSALRAFIEHFRHR